jgi:hypothetical protein
MFSPVSSSSISFSSEIVGGQLLQVSPLQFPQAHVQKSPVFLHPQFPPQPDLHLQNIIVKQYNILSTITILYGHNSIAWQPLMWSIKLLCFISHKTCHN